MMHRISEAMARNEGALPKGEFMKAWDMPAATFTLLAFHAVDLLNFMAVEGVEDNVFWYWTNVGDWDEYRANKSAVDECGRRFDEWRNAFCGVEGLPAAQAAYDDILDALGAVFPATVA